jgi:hypothetical protein
MRNRLKSPLIPSTAVLLCCSLVLFPQLRVCSAAAVPFAANVKSESQYRSEATRYDNAIRAIATISTMSLDTTDDLKKAVEIVKKERPNLALFLSKYVASSLDDRAFIAGVKKRSTDKQSAQELFKEVSADRKAVLKIEGADALTRRLQQSAEADATVLRRASDRLKQAVDKLKKARQATNTGGSVVGVKENFQVVPASFKWTALTKDPIKGFEPEPQVLVIIASIALALVIAFVVEEIVIFGFELFTFDPGNGDPGDCEKNAEKSFSGCEDVAAQMPFPVNLFTQAECDARLLADQAICLLH